MLRFTQDAAARTGRAARSCCHRHLSLEIAESEDPEPVVHADDDEVLVGREPGRPS